MPHLSKYSLQRLPYFRLDGFSKFLMQSGELGSKPLPLNELSLTDYGGGLQYPIGRMSRSLNILVKAVQFRAVPSGFGLGSFLRKIQL